MYLKTQGLVLRETVYRDADKLLTVLTRDYGKMTVKARGVRRAGSRLKAPCQLLAYSTFTVFVYRGMSTVNEAQTVELFPELRQDLERLSLAIYFAQVAEVLSQEDVPTPELLSLTLNGLYALSRLGKPQALVKSAFEFRAACQAGYTPELSGCRDCGQADALGFVLQDGCLVCSQHAGPAAQPLTPGALAAMRHIASCPLGQLFAFRLSPASQAVLSQVTERYLLTQLERNFSTLDFYHSLFSGGKSHES